MTTLAELRTQLRQQGRQRFQRMVDRPFVYVALGASDAVGVGASDPAHGYVELLAARLRQHFSPSRAVTLSNLAVSGYTILEIDKDEVARVTALAPDLVTLWTGGNDVIQSVDPAEFRTALTHVLALLQRTGAAVFVGSVPDMSLVPLVRSFPGWIMPLGDPMAYAHRHSQELGEIVLRVVPTFEARLVNLPMHRVLTNPLLVARDGFHPSDAGHAELAAAWWQEIHRLLD